MNKQVLKVILFDVKGILNLTKNSQIKTKIEEENADCALAGDIPHLTRA